jgi:ribose transport system permease protein
LIWLRGWLRDGTNGYGPTGADLGLGCAPLRGTEDVETMQPPHSVSSWAPRLRRWMVAYFVLIAWAAEIIFFKIIDPSYFFTVRDFRQIGNSQGPLLILALSLVSTLCVGEIDLSVAATMTMSAIIVAQYNGVDHWSLWPVLIIAMVVSMLIGLINGLLTVYVGVQGIIVTLGMGTALLGLAQEISHSTSIGGVSAGLTNFMNRPIFGVDGEFYYSIIVAVLLWYVFRHTPLGRRILFIGHNREAARLSGVKVARLRLLAFVFGSTLAGFAGIVLVGVTGGLESSSLQPLLLPAFAAAFVGSTIFVPGQVNAFGTWVQNVFYGVALVLAVVGARVVAVRASKRSRV